MAQTLHLVRHGQASAGSANYDRLSTRGREQALHLGDWWRRSGFGIDAAWHGTLERQRDTATLALSAAGLAPTLDTLAALDEYDHRSVDAHLGERHASAGDGAAPVDPEALSYADYATVMRRWRDTTDLPGSLEHWHGFAARGWDAMRGVAARRGDAESLVFFTSGGIISTVLATVLDLDFEHTIDAIWRVRNGSVTSFAYDGEHARLIAFNTIPHLEVHHDPELVTLI